MNPLKQAFFARDYKQLEATIIDEASSFTELAFFDQNQIIKAFLRQKKYDFILKLSKTDAVIMDVFELDSFAGSFIETILLNTPFYAEVITEYNAETLLNEVPNQEALDFFDKFVAQIEEIDENIGNETLLKIAIKNYRPIPVLEILVSAGCNVSQMDASDNTLLFCKSQPSVFQWLIDQGLDVNHQNKAGQTPLLQAIEQNNLERIQLLLDCGVDTSIKDKSGNSIFHTALIDKANYALFDLLCEYDTPSLEETNAKGSSLLFNYIDRLYTTGETELKYLNKLLEMGANIHQVNRNAYGEETTILDIAIKKGFAVFECILKHNTQDINLTDNTGNTVLHKVCAMPLNFEQTKAKEQYKMVKLLLKQGADKSIRNTDDKTALDLATDDNLKEKIVQLLLKF